MNKQEALEITQHLEGFSQEQEAAYEILKISTHGIPLRGFHQWADGKELVDAFQVMKMDGNSFYFLFIDWHRNGNYYLVIYASDKSTTYAEIRETVREEQASCFIWKYNPLKRDGQNFERKAFFKQMYGTTEVKISIPNSKDRVPEFLDALFLLVAHRLQADNSPKMLTSDRLC